jgi:type I restriction enzyme M protein
LNRGCLGDLVGWLARQPFETPKDRQAIRDQLDRGFRNYRDKFSGEYSTPDEITSLMVRLANPKKGESVYDPCFGYAGLLTQAIKYVSHKDGNGNGRNAFVSNTTTPLRIAGVEKRLGSYVLGLTRLVLSGITNPQVELGNSLERQPPSNPLTDGFDVVLANPPWGAKVDLKGSIPRIRHRCSCSMHCRNSDPEDGW